MIKAIHRDQLPACLEIMKLGYENTAVTFGMTEENCPKTSHYEAGMNKTVFTP